MRAFEFTVPGKPVAKGRPRFVRASGRAFTPAATVNYEACVRLAAELAGVCVLSGPLELCVRAFWACPRGQERQRKPRGEYWKPNGPDADNVLKAVSDALNGIAYQDDRQIVRACVEKRQAKQGEAPRVDVCIREMEPECP